MISYDFIWFLSNLETHIFFNALLRDPKKPYRDVKRHRYSSEELRKKPAPLWTRGTKKNSEMPLDSSHFLGVSGYAPPAVDANESNVDFELERFFWNQPSSAHGSRRPSGNVGWKGPKHSTHELLQMNIYEHCENSRLKENENALTLLLTFC
jgi:hypothetical protein